MKKLLAIFILTAFAMGCKSDRKDNSTADTTLVEPLSVAPAPDTPTTASDASSITEPTDVKLANKNKHPIENTVTNEDKIRVKKVSRKGRIILQLLKMNREDKIEADKDGIYSRAEVMPLFPGGEKALREFIESHIQYPDNALNSDIQGTVKVYFAVDEQGKIYAPVITSQKLGYGLEEEALRVVKQMPRWIPGQVNGKNIKTGFTLPITYRLD